jgi:hypothetical protein
MRLLALALALAAAPAAASPHPFAIKFDTADWTKIGLDVAVDPSGLSLEKVTLGGRVFDKVALSEALNFEDEGLPELPTAYRLVAVDPALYYTVDVRYEAPVVLNDILLAPVQRALPDRPVPARFKINDQLYATDMDIGSETVIAYSQVMLAGVAVLPVKITPVHYNPAQRRLTVWTKVHATIRGESKAPSKLSAHRAPLRLRSVTPFQRSQLAHLVENQEQLLAGARSDAAARFLVLTTPDLAPYADRIAAAATKPGVTPTVYVLNTGMTPAALKAFIQGQYNLGGLDSVLLLGDEARLPLYDWGNHIPGDSWYSFLDGTDSYADIGLGRLPAASPAEATLFAAKLEAYARQKSAAVNKDVLLVAHNQEYPGKYTANQESVRSAANPRGLRFSTQYAGTGATNATASQALALAPAIISYRGHGSQTAWYDWDADDRSFGPGELKALPPADDHLSIFWSIACENGALQAADRSFAEEALLLGSPAHPGTGAVAVLASTADSMTEYNDAYNANLFEYLQSERDLSLGNLNALAANREVRDNGGILPQNVMMYILYSHPYLTPPLD